MQFFTKIFNALIVGLMRIENRSMSGTGKQNQLLGNIGCFFKIFGFIQAQNRRELFRGERFVMADFRSFADQGFGFDRNFNSGHFGNFICRLSDNAGIQFTVNKDDFGEFFFLFGRQQISSAIFQFFTNVVINVFDADNRLLGSANHTVVKSFAHQD